MSNQFMQFLKKWAHLEISLVILEKEIYKWFWINYSLLLWFILLLINFFYLAYSAYKPYIINFST